MFKQFLKKKEGQTTVEYVLIIMVIVVVITVLGKGMQSGLDSAIKKVFSGVNQKIEQLMKAASGGG